MEAPEHRDVVFDMLQEVDADRRVEALTVLQLRNVPLLEAHIVAWEATCHCAACLDTVFIDIDPRHAAPDKLTGESKGAAALSAADVEHFRGIDLQIAQRRETVGRAEPAMQVQIAKE